MFDAHALIIDKSHLKAYRTIIIMSGFTLDLVVFQFERIERKIDSSNCHFIYREIEVFLLKIFETFFQKRFYVQNINNKLVRWGLVADSRWKFLS